MALPRIFQRYLYRHGWKRDSYERNGEPGDLTVRMLSIVMGLATCEIGGGKVLFGMPPGRDFTDEERAEVEAANAKMKEILDPANWTPEEIDRKYRFSTPEMRASVLPERRDGQVYIPVWILHNDGEWHLHRASLFPEQYAYIQHLATERLVTIDASPQHPQPRKWLEYTNFLDEDKHLRHFAEVKLYYEENLSFTIEILSTRKEPADVKVARSTIGWEPKG